MCLSKQKHSLHHTKGQTTWLGHGTSNFLLYAPCWGLVLELHPGERDTGIRGTDGTYIPVQKWGVQAHHVAAWCELGWVHPDSALPLSRKIYKMLKLSSKRIRQKPQSFSACFPYKGIDMKCLKLVIEQAQCSDSWPREGDAVRTEAPVLKPDPMNCCSDSNVGAKAHPLLQKTQASSES